MRRYHSGRDCNKDWYQSLQFVPALPVSDVAAQQGATDPEAVADDNLTFPACFDKRSRKPGPEWPALRKPNVVQSLSRNGIGGLSCRVRAVQDDVGLVPEAVRSLLG